MVDEAEVFLRSAGVDRFLPAVFVLLAFLEAEDLRDVLLEVVTVRWPVFFLLVLRLAAAGAEDFSRFAAGALLLLEVDLEAAFFDSLVLLLSGADEVDFFRFSARVLPPPLLCASLPLLAAFTAF